MSYGRILTFGLRWTTKVLLVFLLVVSISGTPFGAIDSSKPEFNDDLYSIENQSINSPEVFDASVLSSSYQEDNTTTSLGLQSTIERFVNTSWNIKSEESLRLEANNGTIDWPEPRSSEDSDIISTVAKDLNSSTSKEAGIESLRGDSSGTTLLSDSCSSTSGWIVQNSWTGEALMSEVQSGISLLVSNDRFMSSSIPSSSAYSHGGMWLKTLTYPASLGEGLDLEVDFEHVFNWNKAGHAGVAVFDMNDEIMFRVHITDAWYGSRSDAFVGYYALGTDTFTQAIQKSYSWSGTLRIWYDRTADAIKASILGTSYTLVTDPSEAELGRFAKSVSIYFTNKLNFAYESKFIDSIYLGVDTDPDTAFEAYPLTPAMDGHWFPRESYSRLYFQVNQPYIDTSFYLRIKIEADQDTYDRTLTVTVEGVVHYTGVITNENGFDARVPVWGYGTRKVELKINWGAHVEKGWKLVHFYPERANGEPLEIVGEYFPVANIARLTYLARLGTDSRINLKLEADQDTYSRTTRVYVDGQLKHSDTGDDAWEWSLGNYPEDSVHEVVVELQFGGYAQWGKRLSINRVHHFKGGVEVDYMSGHAPSQEDLDVLEAYYILLGYDRAEFHLDDEIPYLYEFDLSTDGIWPSSTYWTYSNAYRDHIGDSKWEWLVCANYLISNGIRESYWGGHWGGYGIFIHDQLMIDNGLYPISACRRTIILHEYGHHINIIDWKPNGEEQYCANFQCAMASAQFFNILYYPFYCAHHWSEHRWPGW